MTPLPFNKDSVGFSEDLPGSSQATSGNIPNVAVLWGIHEKALLRMAPYSKTNIIDQGSNSSKRFDQQVSTFLDLSRCQKKIWHLLNLQRVTMVDPSNDPSHPVKTRIFWIHTSVEEQFSCTNIFGVEVLGSFQHHRLLLYVPAWVVVLKTKPHRSASMLPL